MLSLPFALRYRVAYDAPRTSAVLGVFVRAGGTEARRLSGGGSRERTTILH